MYLHSSIKLGMNEKRKGYPSDVSNEEWGFCVNYLTLMKEDAPQREHSLRAVFNALRYLIRVGGAWRGIVWGAAPVGAIAAGSVAAIGGLRLPLVLAGVLQCTVAVVLARPLLRSVRESAVVASSEPEQEIAIEVGPPPPLIDTGETVIISRAPGPRSEPFTAEAR